MRGMRIKEGEVHRKEQAMKWKVTECHVAIWGDEQVGGRASASVQSKHSILLSSPFIYHPLPMSLFPWLHGCAGIEGTGRTRTPAWVQKRVMFRFSKDQSLCVFVCVCALFCMFLGCRFSHLSSALPPCIPYKCLVAPLLWVVLYALWVNCIHVF